MTTTPEQRVAARRVGTVGSPSSTSELTVDVSADAIHGRLLGDMVFLSHDLQGGECLLAIGTIGDIETRNRWHEDPNMKGVLKLHGNLPNLSADGDVRTAKVVVQAVYRTGAPQPPFGSPPVEDGGAMAMSPTTGAAVYVVDQQLVDGLIERHQDSVVYLGHIYNSDVLLPMFIRQFADPATDGAYHVGIFGRTGSGKTELAAHWMAMQLRHPEQSMLVFDPQGQFSKNRSQLKVDPAAAAAFYGHPVELLTLGDDLRLRADAPLLVELLGETGFWRQLNMKSNNEYRKSAAEELVRLLRDVDGWTDRPADEVLRSLLTDLAADDRALTRIYKTKPPREALQDLLQHISSDTSAFAELIRHFAAPFSLFQPNKADGSPRRGIWGLVSDLTDSGASARPYVVVDLSATPQHPWLANEDVQARLIRVLITALRLRADERWRETQELVNCAVVYDEAHRFASGNPASEELTRLAQKLVGEVRETRKVGIGWMFITQQVRGLHSQIYAQLKVKAFGYGLTTGADLDVIKDEVGGGGSLELYRSFADPGSRPDRKVYPFMFAGPVSPLSFTSAPVFLQVFTEKAVFQHANHIGGSGSPSP